METDVNDSILTNIGILGHWKMCTWQSITMLHRLINLQSMCRNFCMVKLYSQNSPVRGWTLRTTNNIVMPLKHAKLQLFSLTVEGMILVYCLVCPRCLCREWRTYEKEEYTLVYLTQHMHIYARPFWTHSQTHRKNALKVLYFCTMPPTTPKTM